MVYFPVSLPEAFYADGRQGDSAGHHAVGADLSGAPAVPRYVEYSPSGEQFIVLCAKSVSLWNSQANAILSTYSSVAGGEFGEYKRACWNADGSALAITTSSGYCIFLRVTPLQLLEIKPARKLAADEVPTMTAKVVRATFDDDIGVVMASSAAFSHTITTVIRRNSEVCLATTAGVLERSPWVARGKQIFDATSAIVLADLSFSAGEARIKAGVHVIHMDHSAELGLLALALSDGTAFVLPDGSKPTCRWVAGVSPRDVAGDGPAARVVALNSRFRLLAVGLKDGDTAVYSISDTKSGEPVPVLSHTLDGRGSRGCGPRTVGSADAPGAGPVASLDWTDDGYAIAVAWARGGFAVWSVFGSPLSDTAADNALSRGDPHHQELPTIRCIKWGPSGYHLLVVPGRGATSSAAVTVGQLIRFQYVRSAMTTNACLANQFNVALIGTDRACISPGSNCSNRLGDNVERLCDVQWQVVSIPPAYLEANWPIRLAAFDPTGNFLAVAGRRGFAHYSKITRKWRLFGNQSQEQGFTVSGLVWWRTFIVVATRDLTGKDELRFYSRSFNLDSKYLAHAQHGRSAISLNTFGDYLVVYTKGRKILIYRLSEPGQLAPQPVLQQATTKASKSASMSYSRDHEPPTSSAARSSVDTDERLSSINSESPRRGSWTKKLAREAAVAEAASKSPVPAETNSARRNTSEPPTVVTELMWRIGLGDHVRRACNLISISLIRVGTDPDGADTRVGPEDTPGAIIVNIAGNLLMFSIDAAATDIEQAIMPPVLLADGIENYWAWAPQIATRVARHLTEALWLGCGRRGMKVWLPLYPESDTNPDSFLVKRVMLPFELNSIYPLSVLFEDAVVLGASHESYSVSGHPFLFCSLERRTQVYLHHILRQLLRRRQEGHALEIAQSCATLPYFPHVLELMLHEVLEDADGIDEGDDALFFLKGVLSFLEYFPSMLNTIVQCARKSEMRRWRALFSVAGDPNELYRKCVEDGKLNTAASYLIILQSLESPACSRRYAAELMHIAADAEEWELTRDLVRFLRATAEYDAAETKGFGVATEAAAEPGQGHASSFAEKQLRDSSSSQGPEFALNSTSLTGILSDYALGLLTTGALRQLGRFSAGMNFSLSRWAKYIASSGSARIDDFAVSLKALYTDLESTITSDEIRGTETEKDDGRAYNSEDAKPARDQTSKDSPDDFVDSETHDGKADSSFASDECDVTTYVSAPSTPAQPSQGPMQEVKNQDVSRVTTARSDNGYCVSAAVARAELGYMMNILFDAGVHDWAFVAAIALNDTPAAIRILEEVSTDKNRADGVFGMLKRAGPLMSATMYANISAAFRSAIPEPSDIERVRRRSMDPGGAQLGSASDCVLS